MKFLTLTFLILSLVYVAYAQFATSETDAGSTIPLEIGINDEGEINDDFVAGCNFSSNGFNLVFPPGAFGGAGVISNGSDAGFNFNGTTAFLAPIRRASNRFRKRANSRRRSNARRGSSRRRSNTRGGRGRRRSNARRGSGRRRSNARRGSGRGRSNSRRGNSRRRSSARSAGGSAGGNSRRRNSARRGKRSRSARRIRQRNING